MKNLKVFRKKNNNFIQKPLKKWHKLFLDNIKDEVNDVYPFLELNHKKLYFTMYFNSYNSLIYLSIGLESFENEILVLENILNEKDKIKEICNIHGLLK